MYLSEGILLLPRNIPQPYLPYILPTPNFQVFFLLSNRPARFQFQIVPNALPLFEKFDQVCIVDVMMLPMLKCCEISEGAPFTYSPEFSRSTGEYMRDCNHSHSHTFGSSCHIWSSRQPCQREASGKSSQTSFCKRALFCCLINIDVFGPLFSKGVSEMSFDL